jgi:shikimate dehydrogenase
MAAAPPRSGQRFLTGLIGNGIGASRSPWLHEQEAEALGVRLVYMLYDLAALGLGADELPAMIAAAKRMRFSGVNVTHPYKQAVIPHLDALSDGAARIGAVNTIAFVEGRAIGYNTDSLGFGEALTRGLPGAALGRVVQIGAGGAGAATAHALLDRGVGRLVLHDQDEGRLAGLLASLTDAFGADRVELGIDLARSLAEADGVVNATPMGMVEHPGLPLPESSLRPDLWVADIVYFPLETELLRRARARGCRTLDGSFMVVFQAAAAFEIFTGLASDRERMLDAFRRSLEPGDRC